MNDRYQNQPWHIKLWRRRFYLPIPFNALSLKISHPEDPMALHWRLAIGLAQSKMKWYYDWEEVKGRLFKK